MAKTSTKGASAPGRVPPPTDKRFVKGKSGNPHGRPRGAVSLDAITRKFALRQDTILIGGKPRRLSRIAIALQVLKAQAADGKPAAVRLLDEVRALVSYGLQQQGGSILLVPPPPVSLEAYIAEEKARTKDIPMPGTAINLEAEAFQKAVQGEVSAYGAALLARHNKYRG